MKIATTLRSMLTKRGYTLTTPLECPPVSNVADVMIGGERTTNGATVRVIAAVLNSAECAKLTVKIVRELKQWCNDNNTSAIVACAKPPTPSAKDEVNQNDSPIQTFLFQNLQIDITEHELVPHHQQLSDDEANRVLKAMFLKRDQLPKLLTSDAVCRFYNFSPHSVIKIDRNNGHMLETAFYRHVVHASQ